MIPILKFPCLGGLKQRDHRRFSPRIGLQVFPDDDISRACQPQERVVIQRQHLRQLAQHVGGWAAWYTSISKRYCGLMGVSSSLLTWSADCIVPGKP
jgi:hypothetical protein